MSVDPYDTGEWFQTHRALLDGARAAIEARVFWSAFSEVPRTYGEEAAARGRADYRALVGQPFDMPHPEVSRVGDEVSPFGGSLGITYPAADAATLIAASRAAQAAWAAQPVEARTGIALEILARLNRASFLIAHAVEQTTGQAFAMAFQAGGPHAQDRGLEAVAYAHAELARIPATARWEKPAGRTTIRLDKRFQIVPRGVGLVIACATFPTWNSYPAIFANLVTGNTVIVKPHPAVILPLALTVRIGREVLRDAGLDPNVLLLAADTAEAPLAPALATDPAVGLVDFTGSPTFAAWLRANVRGAQLATEEAGVNTVVIAGAPSFSGMCQNLAFSLALYSGQMCTTPKCLFIPRAGIDTDEGHKSLDDVVTGLTSAIDALLADPSRAAAVLGAIQNPATLARIDEARGLGRIARDSAPLAAGPARTATPLVVVVDAADEAAYRQERFGPVSLVVATDSADDAIRRAADIARTNGAITAALYATDAALIERAAAASAAAGVPLSVNLTGGIYVNQSAAFSDYHVSGANPAGNACLTDAAFVAGRFRVVCVRQPAQG